MNRRRGALAVLGFGLVGSQAGHVLAYQLRFGDAARAIQSSGAHAYFPSVAKTVLGVAAMALITGLLIIGFARVVAGRRIERESAPSFIRLLAPLYTIQLALFAGQETAEALLNGAPASSAAVLLLWGTVGQLPIAAVGALALRWLLARLHPALALLARYAPAFQLLPYTAAVVIFPVAAEMVPALDGLANGFNPRGPPSSS
jgi:hypothetical protein